MVTLNFAVDSDPFHGGHENNEKVVKALFPEIEIESNFEGFGITGFKVKTEMSRTELQANFEQLYADDKIRGAQLR